MPCSRSVLALFEFSNVVSPSLLVNSFSRKQLPIMLCFPFASSCSPSSSVFLFVSLASSLGWSMFDLTDHLGSSFSLLFLLRSLWNPSSFSPSTSFRWCSSSARLSSGSPSTLLVIAFSGRRSFFFVSSGMKEASTLHGVTSGWIQEQKKKQIESWTGAERCLCKVTTGQNKHEDTISIQFAANI